MLRVVLVCVSLVVFCLARPASAQQAPQASCEERLTALEKLVVVIRAERDRAQEQMSHAWSLAERYEREKKAVSSPPVELPK